MLKSEAAATLTPQNSDYDIVFPKGKDKISFLQRFDTPFSDSVINFLGCLSASLLKDAASRRFPDVTTFAFFCRKASLLRLKERHTPPGLRLGRGILFHIAPGNVPVNFAYSLVAGLLAGNSNIVKLSSRPFPQVDLIISHLEALSAHEVARRIVLVRYPHESEASSVFSQMADARIIWGGDDTIARLRSCPTPPRSTDICFADRYSLCALRADTVCAADVHALDALVEKFYNDTYLFDQNACSAPHLIAWIGDEATAERARNLFWPRVHAYVKGKYQFQPIMGIDKLMTAYSQALAMNIYIESDADNLLRRVSLARLDKGIDAYRCHSGYFSEVVLTSLDGLAPVITRRYQTLAYYGFSPEELTAFMLQNRPVGVDRLVPVGETTSFSLIWDGYDLMNMLSREITVS